MAVRRMFSLKIVDTDAFLDMPPTSQLLYFHLAMRADDDGFVANPKKILRITSGNDDDLKLLMAKRFLLAFESGVVVIKHWRIHNLIRGDRYSATTYLREKSTLELKENGSYTEKNKNVIPNGNQMEPQVRLGKVSIVKDNTGLNESTNRNEIKFPAEDYKTILDTYQQLKGIRLQGREYLPVQQSVKTMFLSNRTPEDIIGCMKWLDLKDEKWKENWTIDTVKKKMPEYVAGANPVYMRVGTLTFNSEAELMTAMRDKKIRYTNKGTWEQI